jgi:hypothetical protein
MCPMLFCLLLHDPVAATSQNKHADLLLLLLLPQLPPQQQHCCQATWWPQALRLHLCALLHLCSWRCHCIHSCCARACPKLQAKLT